MQVNIWNPLDVINGIRSQIQEEVEQNDSIQLKHAMR